MKVTKEIANYNICTFVVNNDKTFIASNKFAIRFRL